MNFQELQSHVRSNERSSNIPPVDAELDGRPRWKLERDEMQAHYNGKSLEVIRKAFPNEEAAILQYRLKISQPITRGIMLKAIDEVWRLFSGSRFSISFSNVDFETYVSEPKWEGMSFLQWIFRVGYACRVVDPNGYIMLIPTGAGIENPQKRVDIEFLYIASNTIIEERKDLIAWRDAAGGDMFRESVTYYMTDEVFAKSMPNRPKELVKVYEHKAGRMPGVKLGGRTVIEIENGKPVPREISDFTHALAMMNGLQIMDNQYLSVMLASCFPHRFIQGTTCGTCNGTGLQTELMNSGEQVTHTCTTCNGAKLVFPLSPLLGYFINPAPPGVTPEERSAMANRKPIEFAAPDIATIQFLAERRDKLKKEVEEVLDIQRAQTYAQSGVSKEKDRESAYIQISRIADYWFGVVIKTLYEVAQIYWEPVIAKRGQISVTAPVSFDIKTETDLLAEFIEMYSSAPAIVRFPAFTDYVKKRFSNDQPLARAATLALQYSPFVIANEAEKRSASPQEIAKATYAMPHLLAIMRETNGFTEKESPTPLSDEQILELLAEKMQPALDALNQETSATLLNQLNV